MTRKEWEAWGERFDDDSILPPIRWPRVREIANTVGGARAYADLIALAEWLENYERFVRDALESASKAERN